MKKLLPFLILGLVVLPSLAFAGLSEGCNPAVTCPAGQDYYANACRPHVESVSGVAPSCVSLFGAAPAGQQWGFSCGGGCVQSAITCGGGQIDIDPTAGLNCKSLVSAINDTLFKIWDGSTLRRLVYVDDSACTDGQIIKWNNPLARWECGDPSGDTVNSTTIVDNSITTLDLADGAVTSVKIADGTVTSTDIADGTLTSTDIADGTIALADLNGMACTGGQILKRRGADNPSWECATDTLSIPGCADGQVPKYNAGVWSCVTLASPAAAAVFVGVSAAALNGSLTGYKNANDNYCKNGAGALSGSHICSTEELIYSYENAVAAVTEATESVWINNGPPGHPATVVNDCGGWTVGDNTTYGAIWNFTGDKGAVTLCDSSLQFACCK